MTTIDESELDKPMVEMEGMGMDIQFAGAVGDPIIMVTFKFGNQALTIGWDDEAFNDFCVGFAQAQQYRDRGKATQ